MTGVICKSSYKIDDFDDGDVNITIINSNFNENQANTAGVLYFVTVVNIVIENSNFAQNQAVNTAVFRKRNEGNFTVTSSNFTKNHANDLGVILNSDGNGLVKFDNNFFDSNWIDEESSWVFLLDDKTTVTNNLFVNKH